MAVELSSASILNYFRGETFPRRKKLYRADMNKRISPIICTTLSVQVKVEKSTELVTTCSTHRYLKTGGPRCDFRGCLHHLWSNQKAQLSTITPENGDRHTKIHTINHQRSHSDIKNRIKGQHESTYHQRL